MLNIFELPQDDGALPAGKWNVQLESSLTDSFAGARFVDGRNVEPITGRLLKRLCCFMRVVGAVRVEGEPCEMGDVSTLVAPPVDAPVPDAAPTEEAPAADDQAPALVVKKGKAAT